MGGLGAQWRQQRRKIRELEDKIKITRSEQQKENRGKKIVRASGTLGFFFFFF